MIKNIKIASRSRFAKNSLILMIGSSIGQVISILVSPFLSRIYSVEDFGLFSFFSGIVSIGSVIATAKYELAIILPKNNSNAKALLYLCFYILWVFCTIGLIFAFVLTLWSIKETANIQKIAILIPVAIFFIASNQTIGYWLTRNFNFKAISTNRVIQGITSAIVSCSLGLTEFNDYGLILGFILGQFVSVVNSCISIKEKHLSYDGNKKRLLYVAKRYSSYPRYILPAVLLESISSQAPVFVITALYSSTWTGYYGFSEKLLSVPASIIGLAVGQSFYSQFVKYYNEKNPKIKTFVLRVWLLMGGVAFVPMLLVFIYGENIFSLFFGSNWNEAGKIASIMSIMFFLKFISTPTSGAYLVIGLEKYSLFFGLATIILRPLAIVLGYLLNDFYQGIYFLVITEVTVIVIYNIKLWRTL